jgi:hypothetical protein
MTTQQRSIRPPATPAATPSGQRRTRRGHVAAAVVFVLGLLAAGAWAVLGVVHAWQAPDDFARSKLPGAITVQVTDTGTSGCTTSTPTAA